MSQTITDMRQSPFLRFLSILTIGVMLSLTVVPTAGAIVAPLEIIQPRAGLDQNNRFYRAYPGLPFVVQIAAIGGVYPNTYTLAGGPQGMTIDSDTGVLSWNGPTMTGSPHAVTVRVTDAAGTTASVSWTITVTTAGFRFLDAVNGKTVANGGTGTLDNPWRTMADWYINKYDSTYRNIFLYYRAGTYYVNTAPIEDPTGFRRMAMTNVKPVVWLAYPGEAPVIDTTDSHVGVYDGCNNLYFEGLRFQNFTTHFGVRADGGSSNVTFRNNTFGVLKLGQGGSGTNASALMISKGSSLGSNWSITDNRFEGVQDNGYGILGYYTNKLLIERNVFSGINHSGGKAIGPKDSTVNWFIRDNRLDVISGEGIGIQNYSTGAKTQNIEIAYNLVKVQSGTSLLAGVENVEYGLIESYRNTYSGGVIRISNLTNTRGPVSFTNDVIVNSSSSANKVDTVNNTSSPSRIIVSGLLTGSPSTGILDSAGNLAGSYAQYVGTKGYQRGTEETVKPKPPGDVVVE